MERQFQALGRWAARSPTHDPGLPLSADSLLLSLRTMLHAGRAEGIDAGSGCARHPRPEAFLCHLAHGRIEVAAGALDRAELVFAGSATSIAGAIYGGRTLDGEGEERCGSRATARSPRGS